MKIYTVIVEFVPKERSSIWEEDRFAENIINRGHDGSGFCLFNRMRDINWDYKVKSYAEKAVKKLKKYRRFKNVYLYEWNEDD